MGEYGAKIACEFFGEVARMPGSTQITGTLLTNKGRYCAVNLVSDCEREAVVDSTKNLGSLPTLLTGLMTPIREGNEGKPSFFSKGGTNVPAKVDSKRNMEAAFAVFADDSESEEEALE